MGTKSAWTPERRARQAEIIRRTRPWDKSTGPRSAEGKQTSSRNALLGPIRAARRSLKSYNKLNFKLLRLAIKLRGGSLPVDRNAKLFPDLTEEQVWEIGAIEREMDDVAANILTLMDGEKGLGDDLQALHNFMVEFEQTSEIE